MRNKRKQAPKQAIKEASKKAKKAKVWYFTLANVEYQIEN
jgi:hypothetical protein